MDLDQHPLPRYFRTMHDHLERGVSHDIFAKKVRTFLDSVTHELNSERRIHLFGQKLLFPHWPDDWQKTGFVYSVLFGDVTKPGLPCLLHQLVTELVASEAGSQLPSDQASYRWRIECALRAFLIPLGHEISPPPSEFSPVESKSVPPSPLGFVVSSEVPAEHFLGSVYAMRDPHAQPDPVLAKQLAMFDHLTLEKPRPEDDPIEEALVSKPSLSVRYCWLRDRPRKIASFASIRTEHQKLRFRELPNKEQIINAFQTLQKALRNIDCAPSVEVNAETGTVSLKY